MDRDSNQQAIAECEALCKAYGDRADARDADGLAALYVEDGVFDRLGQRLVGRDAIRDVIASRPLDVWTWRAAAARFLVTLSSLLSDFRRVCL